MISKEEFIKLYLDKFEKIHGKSIDEGTMYDKYVALAGLVKDLLAVDWVKTNNLYSERDQKQVYYFAMEFLPGKFLGINLLYRGIRETAREALKDLGLDLEELEELESDAALGNGGLGRLGACLLDSMASMGIAGHGCCLRYKYGLFRQRIVDGFQVELPDNWLVNGNIWEIRKPDKAVEVRFGGTVRTDMLCGRLVFIHENYEAVKAVPYDVPIAGYQNGVVNTLRLWRAEAAGEDFDLSSFPRGDYLKVLEYKQSVEAISQILYPDDSSSEGKLLRLKQQYFLVSAGLQSILRRYKKKHGSLLNFENKVAIHLNDTHPVLCIPELMRLLIDVEGMGWDEAWRITTGVMSYTNHTILPEALEKWPVEMFKTLLPRLYLIVQEINERLGRELWQRFPGDWQKVDRMAVMNKDQVVMAHLAVVGSSRLNGVSRVHTEILQKQVLSDFYGLYPQKFSNKTNGVSHRRFLLKANPGLSSLITEVLGPEWIGEPQQLSGLAAFANDASFLEKAAAVKRENKLKMGKLIFDKYGIAVNPDSIFDVQVKRIHAYKRQLLNVLHILDLFNRLKDNPQLEIVPRTFIFGGKAAPGYYLAKKIIKLINTVAAKINSDKLVRDKLKVVFLEDYNVSLAERVIPAADVSEQISTAGKEASGTGNMKFMMNGAVTVCTLDGANIEIRDAVGEENIICFGLTVDEVLGYYQQGGYSAWEEYRRSDRLRRVIDQLVSGFLPAPAEEFREIYNFLLVDNDEFFHLKDFSSYTEAQDKVERLYRETRKWLRMSVSNTAQSGRFSSDRTVAEYAGEIWQV
ncbi:MAG: glycogen/starch/alpha-glucan phosphorylase [Peptococcaceae bacterium]|jgi:starch phosphorylase|nr:glycogen/starch/alpha-glucan phosphorylase [Peptococcaceae bacterium]MDH7525671.1 glycogen/starch/alpha-glucan phosphorylase [Peptococcaceae bacterium]